MNIADEMARLFNGFEAERIKDGGVVYGVCHRCGADTGVIWYSVNDISGATKRVCACSHCNPDLHKRKW
jgi:hypothetical protein